MRQLLITIIAMMPNMASASSYPDPGEGFLTFLVMSFIVSIGLYVIFGIILMAFDKLYVAYMVPVFLVMMAAGAATIFEVMLMQLMGTLPGGVLIGALLSTGTYIYLVKYNIRKDKEKLNNNSD